MAWPDYSWGGLALATANVTTLVTAKTAKNKLRSTRVVLRILDLHSQRQNGFFTEHTAAVIV
jgi:hypothetical protein